MLREVLIDPADLERAADAILEAWKDALVVHIRPTAPVGEDIRAFYDQLLPRIGTPCLLAEDVRAGGRDVQRTGELWMEVRYDPAFPDAYRHSPAAQPLHTDGSYIPSFPNATLMCCVHNAGVGGETTFIAGKDLVAVLEAEHPELLRELQAMTIPHARSGDHRAEPVIRQEGGDLLLNWNYYCVDPQAPAEALELRQRFFEFLRDSPGVKASLKAVKLAPGDGVTWKDQRVLHGRNAFVANEVSERFIWKCAVDIGVFAGRAAGV